jgi:hypothetical protein
VEKYSSVWDRAAPGTLFYELPCVLDMISKKRGILMAMI